MPEEQGHRSVWGSFVGLHTWAPNNERCEVCCHTRTWLALNGVFRCHGPVAE